MLPSFKYHPNRTENEVFEKVKDGGEKVTRGIFVRISVDLRLGNM